MAFCSSCGKEVPENVQFCRNCGAKQEGAPSATPSAPPPTRKRPLGVTTIVVLFTLFGIYGVFFIPVDLGLGYNHGWGPWLLYNLALLFFYTPVDFAMAVGLQNGRLWGWKLAMASLLALFLLSTPLVLLGPLAAKMTGMLQIMLALPFWLYLAYSTRARTYCGAERAWLSISKGYKPPA